MLANHMVLMRRRPFLAFSQQLVCFLPHTVRLTKSHCWGMLQHTKDMWGITVNVWWESAGESHFRELKVAGRINCRLSERNRRICRLDSDWSKTVSSGLRLWTLKWVFAVTKIFLITLAASNWIYKFSESLNFLMSRFTFYKTSRVVKNWYNFTWNSYTVTADCNETCKTQISQWLSRISVLNFRDIN